MNRRNTLTLLGAAALGLNFPALAFQPIVKMPILGAASGDVDEASSATRKVICRIIGVGDAGCSILLTAWSSGLLHITDCQSEFACVNMGRKSIQAAIQANRLKPGTATIRTLRLARFGAGGNVNIARAAAQKHETALRSLIDGAEVVILVCGVGGATGSGVSPILASMAQEVGALTLAVLVTPFNWELGRYPNAFRAVKDLEHQCDYMVSLSNQSLGEAMGDEALLDDLIKQQELLGMASIQSLVIFGGQYCRGPAS